MSDQISVNNPATIETAPAPSPATNNLTSRKSGEGFYLANLTSQLVRSLPFERLIELPPRPEFSTKAAMVKWAQSETTKHCFYNFSEPIDRNRRLTKDNPVRYLHGVVADYDAKIERKQLLDALAKVPADFPVAYASTTYSKGARLVWIFEVRIPMFSGDIVKAFMGRLQKELKLTKLLPGLDEPAFIDPAKYFELGTEWFKVDPTARISKESLARIAYDVSQKVMQYKTGAKIPFDIIEAEVHRQFPGRWIGPFQEGARGVRFWDPQATNPTGAWIRQAGVQAFTGEGAFLSWSAILGKTFVRTQETKRLGKVLSNTFYDGLGYWIRNTSGAWHSYNLNLLRLRLKESGLDEGPPGALSEIDKAVIYLSFEARIDGAFPFLYRNEVEIEVNRRRYLNVSRVKPVQPETGRRTWGEGFPWLAHYLEQIFDPEQREVFLSWLSHYYKSALEQKIRKGQALFIAGPHGIGKTFLSQIVIGGLMGGTEEATTYLLGKSEFNSSLFESPVWTIDDAVANTDSKSHDIYSQIVKKVVANFSMTYRRMYANPVTLPWEGRVVVTLNDDPESITMLPNIEQSMLDKVIFLKATQTSVDFKEAHAVVHSELSSFGAFLRIYEIPKTLLGDCRFGMKAYHHPELLRTAKMSSTTAAFREVLEMWREQYFRLNTTAPHWEGTPTQLLVELTGNESLRTIVRDNFKNAHWVGRCLNKLIQQHAIDGLENIRSHDARNYRITRPAVLSRGAFTTKLVPKGVTEA